MTAYGPQDSSDRDRDIESLSNALYEMDGDSLHLRLTKLSHKHSLCADAVRQYEKAMETAAEIIYYFEEQA